jgi:hypothetical protein
VRVDRTWLLAFAVFAGAFVWWFAPLGLYACDMVNGVQQCYLAEDEFEVMVARLASIAGGVLALGAGVTLAATILSRRRDRSAGT